MALSAATGWASFDADTNSVSMRDMSPYLLAALNQEHQFLNMVPMGSPATNTKIEWMEQTLNPGYITAAEAMDGSETGLDITDAQASLVKKGDLLRDTADTGAATEVMQITAVGAAGSGGLGAGYTLLTVTRGYESTDAETHLDGATYRIMPSDQQGSGPGSDQSRARTTRYNYIQTLGTDVIIAGDTLAVDWYNVTDELANSVAHRAIEVRDKLRDLVLNGIRLTSGAPSDTAYGTMGGIIEWIKQTANSATWGTPVPTANTTYDTTSEALTYDVFSDMVGAIYDHGVSDGNFIAAMPRNLYEVIGQLPDGQVRRQYSNGPQTYGSFVDTVVTRQGIPVKVFIESFMPTDAVCIIDTSRVKLRPLNGYTWTSMIDPVGTNRNDYAAVRILGKYSLEIHNPDKAHALHTGLTA